jgi:hypothetical protein
MNKQEQLAEQIAKILQKTDTCFGDCDTVKECSHTGHGCYLWKKYAEEIADVFMGVKESYLNEIINYIKHDAEIPIPIERFFKDGESITKKEYGLVLLESLCLELRERFCPAALVEAIKETPLHLPTDAEIEKYSNGNFGFEGDTYAQERAFISGCEWTRDWIRDKNTAQQREPAMEQYAKAKAVEAMPDSEDDKHWYALKDLMVAAIEKNLTPEDWVNICKGLGYNVSRASSSNEDYVPSNSNTDDTSVVSHSCTSCSSIEQVLEALDARQQYESEYQLTKPHDIGFHKGTAYAYGQAIELINRLLLNNEQNPERIATQQAMLQGTEAGIQNTPTE